MAGADDVCLACPHLSYGHCVCPDQNVNDLDLKVLDRLGLAVGHVDRWSSILRLIRENVSADHLPNICSKCRWIDFNYCTQGINSICGPPRDDSGAGEGLND